MTARHGEKPGSRWPYAKGVDELRSATGGRPANIYQFACGSVAYFTPDAPDFQEAGELKGDALAKAVRILESLP